MENLIDKDTHELEDILAMLILGDPNITFNKNESEEELRERAKRFVNYMFGKKKLIENLSANAMGLFHSSFQENKPLVWLDYYKSRLISEIRDIKLKKII